MTAASSSRWSRDSTSGEGVCEQTLYTIVPARITQNTDYWSFEAITAHRLGTKSPTQPASDAETKKPAAADPRFAEMLFPSILERVPENRTRERRGDLVAAEPITRDALMVGTSPPLTETPEKPAPLAVAYRPPQRYAPIDISELRATGASPIFVQLVPFVDL